VSDDDQVKIVRPCLAKGPAYLRRIGTANRIFLVCMDVT
jgi:hypothetical protein